MGKTLYIIVNGDHHDYEVVAAFSSYEDAAAFAREAGWQHGEPNIDECGALDEKLGWKLRTVYTATAKNGVMLPHLDQNPHRTKQMGHPNADSLPNEGWDWDGAIMTEGISFVSIEHARELAINDYSQWCAAIAAHGEVEAR